MTLETTQTTLVYSYNGQAQEPILCNDYSGVLSVIEQREAYAVANGISGRDYAFHLGGENIQSTQTPAEPVEQVEQIPQTD